MKNERKETIGNNTLLTKPFDETKSGFFDFLYETKKSCISVSVADASIAVDSYLFLCVIANIRNKFFLADQEARSLIAPGCSFLF